MFDAEDYFRYAGRCLVDLLHQAQASDYESAVAFLAQDSAIPQFCVDLYAKTASRPTFIHTFRHNISNFVYDAPTDAGEDGEDRVVAAFARSQREYTIEELRQALLVPAEAAKDAILLNALHFTIRGHFDAQSTKTNAKLSEAISDLMKFGEFAHEHQLFEAVLHLPAPSLLERLASWVLPLLPEFRPPRARAAQRQYRLLDGMRNMDVGHFIAHAAGGHYDINTYPQDSDLNQGHSQEGKLYRQMESYIAAAPGRFHLARPVYLDDTWVPHFIELSVLVTRDQAEALRPRTLDAPTIGQHALSPAVGGLAWWLGIFRNRTQQPAS